MLMKGGLVTIELPVLILVWVLRMVINSLNFSDGFVIEYVLIVELTMQIQLLIDYKVKIVKFHYKK